MWYQTFDGKFESSTDPEVVTLESMFQELQLWAGENPMNINLGIDYMGVFENRTFLRTELEKVLEKYQDSFESIDVEDFETSDNGEITQVPLKIKLKSGSTLLRNIKLN